MSDEYCHPFFNENTHWERVVFMCARNGEKTVYNDFSICEKDYVDDSDMLRHANRLEVPTTDIGPSIFVPSNNHNK